MKISLDFKVAIIFFLISFLGTIFQSFYTYDSFHWAISQSSIDLLSGQTPYKDFFIHYGIIHTLINSFGLYVSNNDLLSAMVISSLFFASGNFLIFIISKRFFNIELSFYIPLILFLLHPFANHPWPNYQFFFLISCSIFFYFSNTKISLFLSGLFLSLSSLTFENFIYISPIILFLYLFLNKHKTEKYNKYLIFGFFIPLIIFHLYLYAFDLHSYWYKTFNLNSVFLKIYDTSLISLVLNFFYTFFLKGFYGIFSKSYYFFFLVIFIANSAYVIYIIFKIFKKQKLIINEKYFFIISVLSILTLASAFHKLNVFRFSTGPILGIVVLLYILERYFNHYKNYIVSFLVLILISSSFVPIKQDNNKFFPNFGELKFNVENSEISYFKSQKWNKDTWNFLINVNNVTKKIGNNCKNVDHFINYTTDGFIYMIAKKHLKTNQFIYWYDKKNYYDVINEHYNQNIDELVNESIKKKNSIIFVSGNNINALKVNFDLKNFIIFDLPYTYQQKRVFIIYPSECHQS